MRISTSDFLLWRDCHDNAWLKIHEPDVFYATPLSPFDQPLIETGTEVEALARELFPGGQLLPRGSLTDTWAAIQRGVTLKACLRPDAPSKDNTSPQAMG